MNSNEDAKMEIITNQICEIIKQQYLPTEIQQGKHAECCNLFIERKILDITIPEEPPFVIGFMTPHKVLFSNKHISIKTGNITLNFKKMFFEIPVIAGTVSSLSQNKLEQLVCAGLSIWKVLSDAFTVEINSEQAAVLVALWQKYSGNRSIPIEDGYKAVKEYCTKYLKKKISFSQYSSILDALGNIKCLDLIDGKIILKEKISKKYNDPSRLFR